MQPNLRAISALSTRENYQVTSSLIFLFMFFSRFIDINIDKAMQRVLKRHISTGMFFVLFGNMFLLPSSSDGILN